MTLKQLINITSYEIVDKYVEKALIYEKEIEDSEELLQKLIELIYDFLEELMKLVIEYLQAEYQISPSKLTEEQIESLFYTKDGKTFKQRLKKYVSERDNKHKDKFLYNIHRFLSTESIGAINKILFFKAKDHFMYCKVNDLYCCEYCMDIVLSLENWTPVEDIDIKDLPPYHPECQCIIIFSNNKDEE